MYFNKSCERHPPTPPLLDHVQDGIQQNQGQGLHPALRHSIPAAHEEGQRHHQHRESNSAAADEFTFNVAGNRKVKYSLCDLLRS